MGRINLKLLWACIFCAFFVLKSYAVSDIVLYDSANPSVKIKTDGLRHQLDGKWDLSEHRDIEVELENPTDKNLHIKLRCIDEASKKATDGNPIHAKELNAYQKKTVTYKFPKLKYPELDKKFAIMRNNPFGTNDREPTPDFSKIVQIVISPYWSGDSAKFKVIKIVAKPTSQRPAWYDMSEAEFFPFIDKYGQFKYKEWRNKIHSDEELKVELANEERDLQASPSPSDRNKYGGWTKGSRHPATGHFYTKKIDGKWWLIDPEGCLFWSHGVVRVTPSSAITPLDNRHHYFEYLPKEGDKFSKYYHTKDELLAPYYTARGLKQTYDFSFANIERKYGKDARAKYAEMAHRRLRSWGLNTIANSSDSFIFMQDKTPYIDRFEVRGPTLQGSSGWWWPFCDPFDDAFRASVSTHLSNRKDQLNDPWCIGFFVDNEIHWGGTKSLAEWTLQSPSTLEGKKVFVEKLKRKYTDISKLNSEWKTEFKSWSDLLENRAPIKTASSVDLTEFTADMTDQYFRVISEEIRKAAPNKLYMGCRFAGSNPTVMKICAKYTDAISYNIYKDDLKSLKLPAGIDKPIMIGEFHFGALDRGLFHSGLIDKTDQNGRAQAYYNYVKSALEHPNLIGTHWHQFSDQATTGRFDGENFQVGFTDICDTPYSETISKIREIGYPLYEIRSKALKK